MTKLLIAIFVLFTMVGCGQNEPSFKIRNFRLQKQGEIQYVGLDKTNYICQKSDGSFFLVDTLTGSVISDNKDSLRRTYRKYFTSIKNREESGILFEDKRYRVTGHCSGEWGGTVYFEDKTKHDKYECRATCPLVVNKIGTSYYVTSSLAHIRGSTSIIKIEDPAKLLLHDEENSSEPEKKSMRETESHSRMGATVLLDTTGVLAISSFILNNDLFHIVTDYKKTYLCQIINRRFVVMDTLSENAIWDESKSSIFDGHFITGIQKDDLYGFIDQYQNSIKVWWFDK